MGCFECLPLRWLKPPLSSLQLSTFFVQLSSILLKILQNIRKHKKKTSSYQQNLETFRTMSATTTTGEYISLITSVKRKLTYHVEAAMELIYESLSLIFQQQKQCKNMAMKSSVLLLVPTFRLAWIHRSIEDRTQPHPKEDAACQRGYSPLTSTHSTINFQTLQITSSHSSVHNPSLTKF